MNKTILLLSALLCITCLQAQQRVSRQQADIQQTVINMFDALSNRDSVSLKEHCSSDISLYEYGQIWNMDSLILKAITQNQSTGFTRTNRFEFIKTLVDKKTGWVTYRLESAITKEGPPITLYWLESVVVVKEGKKWKVKHLHSTLIKRI
jgi:hypothetical protein